MPLHVASDWFGNGAFCARCAVLCTELALQEASHMDLLSHHLYWRASPSFRAHGRLAGGLPVEGRPVFLYPPDSA